MNSEHEIAEKESKIFRSGLRGKVFINEKLDYAINRNTGLTIPAAYKSIIQTKNSST